MCSWTNRMWKDYVSELFNKDLYANKRRAPADPKKHDLAFVFQEPSSIPWKTVEQNLRFGLELKKIDKKTIDERVENMIRLLGLEEFRDQYPSQLSVSTAQRIIIGRAFAMNNG